MIYHLLNSQCIWLRKIFKTRSYNHRYFYYQLAPNFLTRRGKDLCLVLKAFVNEDISTEKKLEENLKTAHNIYSRLKQIFLELSSAQRKEFFKNCFYLCSEVKKLDNLTKYYSQIKKLDLIQFFTLPIFFKIIRSDKDIETFIKIAKKFKLFKLEEDGQGKFSDLVSLIRIELKDIEKIVDVMVESKKEGFPLKQKYLIKYFDSFRPLTEDLEDLYQAFRIYHSKKAFFEKGNVTKLHVEDFIWAASKNRKPKKFIINYLKIIANKIPISWEEFKALSLDQETISHLINLYIKLKAYEKDPGIEFKDLLNDIYLGFNVVEILKYLVSFKKLGFDIKYDKLKSYILKGGNLAELQKVYLINSTYPKNERLKEPIEHFTFIYGKLGKDFSPLKFLFAVRTAKMLKSNEETKHLIGFEFADIEKRLTEDTISGYDVFEILKYVKFAHSKHLTIDYNLAKIFKDNLGKVIHQALTPQTLSCHKFENITTKDFVLLEAEVEIEAVLNIPNFFTGVDKDAMCHIIKSLFIEQVQKYDHHEEIIKNLHQITKNILDDLLEYEIDLNGKKVKFTDVCKWKPIRVLIPYIDFSETNYKKLEKLKEEFHHHLHTKELELKKLEAEIEIQKAWAKDNNVKYLILKDDFDISGHGGHDSHGSHSSNHHSTQEHTTEHKKPKDEAH